MTVLAKCTVLNVMLDVFAKCHGGAEKKLSSKLTGQDRFAQRSDR